MASIVLQDLNALISNDVLLNEQKPMELLNLCRERLVLDERMEASLVTLRC